MSEIRDAWDRRTEMRRAKNLQQEITALGVGLPDPCADLKAAARAVVETWNRAERERELFGVGHAWLVEPMAALRAAVEAADQQ